MQYVWKLTRVPENMLIWQRMFYVTYHGFMSLWQTLSTWLEGCNVPVITSLFVNMSSEMYF